MSAPAKKKRPSLAATPGKDKALPASPAPEHPIPLIKFELAGGSKTWAPRLKPDRSLDTWLPKIIQRLDIDADPRQVRLAHVREYGREVDMWDNYDLENLKLRAYASPKDTQHVKVYLPSSSSLQPASSPYPNGRPGSSRQPQTPTPSGSGKTPVSGSSSMFETPVTKTKQKKDRKGKGKETVPVPMSTTVAASSITTVQEEDEGTSASAKKRKSKTKTTPVKGGKASPTGLMVTSTPGPSPGSTTPAKGKKRKRSSITPEPSTAPLDEATSAPTDGVISPIPSKRATSPKKKKRKQDKADPKLGLEPSAETTPNKTVPPPPSPASAIPASVNRYKPSRPSPLSRVSEPLEEAEQQEQASVKTPKARKRGKRKHPVITEQVDEPAPVSSGEIDESDLPGPEQTAAFANATPKLPPWLLSPNDWVSKPLSDRCPPHTIPLTFPELLYGRPPEADRRFSSSAIDRLWSHPEDAGAQTSEESEVTIDEFEEEEVARSPSPALRPAAAMMDVEADSVVDGSTKTPVRTAVPAEHAINVAVDEATAEVPGEEHGQIEAPGKKITGKASKEATVTNENEPQNDPGPVEAEASSIDVAENVEVQKHVDTAGTAAPDDEDHGLMALKNPQVGNGDDSQTLGVQSATDAVPASAQPLSPVAPISPVSTSSSSAVDNPKIRTHIHSNHHLALAARGQCVICAGPPHLQKDCPVVKEGLESLRGLLESRRAEKKTPARDASVEAIETWVERLDRITNSVKGIKPVPPAILPLAMPRSQAVRDKSPSPVKSTNPTAALYSPSPSVSPEPQATNTAPTVVQPPPALHRQHSLPPIHLKALTSKAGSVSGLSVSDAVIETGSSASESEDDSGSETGSEPELLTGPAQDSDTESASSKGSSRSGSSSDSTQSGANTRPDVTKLDSQASLMDFLTAPLSQKQKRSARLSAANMHDIGYDEAQDASDIEDSPEPVPAASQAKKSRRGSESSVGEFEEEDETNPAQGEDEDEDDVLPFSQAPSLWPIRGDVESIEPDQPVEEVTTAASPQASDQTRRSFTSLAEGSSPSLAIAELPGSIALQEAIDEDAAPERWAYQPSSIEKQRDEDNRTGHVISQGLMSPPSSAEGSTHDHNSQEPLRATQLLENVPEPDDQEATPRPLTRRVTRSKASQEEPGQLGSAIDMHLSSIPSSSQNSAPASPPRRRLRSASREPTVEPPSPRVGSTTRRVSSSQPLPASASSHRLRSQSPSSSLPVRRSARHTTPLDQIDELASSPAQPTRKSMRRGTTPLRSSQVDELESSPPPPSSARLPEPIPEEDGEIDDGQEQNVHGLTEGPKTPLVPETQVEPESASQPSSQTQSQTRRSSRSNPSPLFMTQGSQIPQTQAYNLYPNLSSSEIGLGETPRSKTGGIGLLSSPISEKRLAGQASKNVNGTAPLGRRVSFKASSPIMEADESDHEEGQAITPDPNAATMTPAHHRNGLASTANGDNHSSQSSSSEDEGVPSVPIPATRRQLRHSISSPSLYPPLPSRLSRSQSASQPSPVSLFPTLGSLPREQLRLQFSSLSQSEASRKPRASLPANMSMSQPVGSATTRSGRASLGGRTPIAVNGNGKGNGNANGLGANGSDSDSSGSSDSDSDEEKTPAGLKGRIARGDQNKKKKRVSGQLPVMRW
ncbi:hypothetical protein IAT40_005321 [Kwoniella sp. CBS 6097]